MARINVSLEDKWEYEYDGNKIVVRNTLDTCELLVNGKVQDAHNGISISTDLHGKLPDGQKIKATVGGLWHMKCSVFVDFQMIEPVANN